MPLMLLAFYQLFFGHHCFVKRAEPHTFPLRSLPLWRAEFRQNSHFFVCFVDHRVWICAWTWPTELTDDSGDQPIITTDAITLAKGETKSDNIKKMLSVPQKQINKFSQRFTTSFSGPQRQDNNSRPSNKVLTPSEKNLEIWTAAQTLQLHQKTG